MISLLDIAWLRTSPLLQPSTTAFYLSVTGLVIAAIIAHYVYVYSYFSRRGIKGPTPVPLFGNMLEKLMYIVPDREVYYLKTYGRVYGFYEMTKPVINIAEPELLKNIFVRDFNYLVDRRERTGHRVTKHFLTALKGDEWRRARNTLTPTFTSGKMKNMMPLMQGCVDLLDQAILDRTKTTKEVDVKRLFGCYTMDVIAKCAFATDTNAHAEEPGSYADMMFKFMTFSKWRILPIFFLPGKLLDMIGYLPNTPGTLEFMEQAVQQMIRQRRESVGKEKRKDMLQLLIEAGEAGEQQHEEDEEVEDKESHHGHESRQSASDQKEAKIKKYLTEDEIVANTFLVLLAGYETTATLLTYTSYALSMNQEKQDKLRQEVKDAFGNGKELDYETVSSLPYLDAVISETLRMYTPVLRVERQVTRDYCIDSIDQSFKKGDVIRVPVYAIHHSDEFYEEPEKFTPERFLPENRHKLVPYTYLPFGAGPRNCIGMRFALLEAKMALAAILLKFKFLPSNRTPVRPDYSKAQILLTAKDIFLNIVAL